MGSVNPSVNPQYLAVAKKVLDRLASDPAFRKQIMEEPDRALAEAGFQEELDAIAVPIAADCRLTCGFRSCSFSCAGNTCNISCRNVFL
jgi:hypothetical protein